MDYTEFSEKIELFANTMNFLYEKQQENIIDANTLNNIAVSLATDVYNNLYTSFETYVNGFVTSEKNVFDSNILTIENYVSDVISFGTTPALSSQFNTVIATDVMLNVENIFKLNYILDYYTKMIDTNDSTSWVYNISEYSKINTLEYSATKRQSQELFLELTP